MEIVIGIIVIAGVGLVVYKAKTKKSFREIAKSIGGVVRPSKKLK